MYILLLFIYLFISIRYNLLALLLFTRCIIKNKFKLWSDGDVLLGPFLAPGLEALRGTSGLDAHW